MALSLPPGYAQLVFRHLMTGDSEPMVNTLGYDTGGATLSGQDLLVSISAAWEAQILPLMPTGLTYLGATMTVGQDGGDPLIYEVVDSSTGTGSGAYLPQNCACLVRKQTALGGRRNQGRMFLPYVLAETSVDNVGVINTTARASVQSAVDALWSALDGLGGEQVVLHSVVSGGVTPLPTPITSYVVDTRIATQRRRLRR